MIMKKQMLLILLPMLVLTFLFNKVNAQPPSNLKIGLNYKTSPKSFSIINGLLNNKAKVDVTISDKKVGYSKANPKDSMVKNETIIKDTVKYWVDSIKLIVSSFPELEKKKSNVDSTLKVLKALVMDTVSVKNQLFDTTKINVELSKLNLLSGNYAKRIDSLKTLVDSLYADILTRMKTAKDGVRNIPYTRITVLTKDISDRILALRKEKYLNRTFIANYMITADTGKAKKAVGSIQDSIKHLITLRTTIRENRKLTRPFSFFPAISKRTAKYFFGNTVDTGVGQNTVVDSSNFYNFQNLSLLYTNNIGTNTTIRAQLFSVYAGPLKFDATTYFSLPKSDSSLKKKDSINALAVLANGGGNVTLNAQLPLVSFNYNSETFLDMTFASFISPKFSFDIDADPSKNAGKFSSYGSAEIVNRLNIVLEKKVQIMGQMTYSNIWGNGLFMDRLGLTADNDRKKMELWSFTLGIGLSKSFSISFTTYKSSVEQISKNLNNTLSFVTNF